MGNKSHVCSLESIKLTAYDSNDLGVEVIYFTILIVAI